MNKFPLIIILLLSLPVVLAAVPSEYADVDFVLINSNDWKDVYQGLMFGKLIDKDVDFILSPNLAREVVDSIPQTAETVLLLQTSGKEELAGIETLLEQRTLTVRTVAGSTDLGIRLASSMTPKGYIVVDEHYPYNAISVTPYALLNEYFVLFADDFTIDEVVDIISEQPGPVITYGLINSRVKEELSQFNPVVIERGGKFDNNLYMVKEFMKEKPVKQIVVTNGEFVELGLIDSSYPILFVGRTKTPDEVIEFVGESNIEFMVVVGNYLTDLTKALKTEVESNYDKELAVFVRFAKTPRVVDEQFNQPHALEYFALPLIEPELFISHIAYNRLTNKLEVTYTNPSDITVFFLSSMTLSSDAGSETIGDTSVQSIVAGQSKTLVYDVDIDSEGLGGSATILFGDYPRSLEYELEADLGTIPVIEIADNSNLEIVSVVYDKTNKAFFITVENPSDVDTYAQLELIDVIIDGLPETIGTKDVFKLAPGEQKEVYVRARLSDLDLLENEDILIKGVYGQRENVLINRVEKTLPLSIRLIDPFYIVVGIGAVIVFIILFFFLFTRKREYECDRCGHREKRRKTTRHHCGGKFKKV